VVWQLYLTSVWLRATETVISVALSTNVAWKEFTLAFHRMQMSLFWLRK